MDGKPERDPADEELVERFLRRVEGMSQTEAGAAISVSGSQVGNYKRGKWKTLNYDTRRAMEDYLGMGVADPDQQWRAGVRFACNRVEEALRELEEVLDSVPPEKGRRDPPVRPPRAQ